MRISSIDLTVRCFDVMRLYFTTSLLVCHFNLDGEKKKLLHNQLNEEKMGSNGRYGEEDSIDSHKNK